MRPGLTGSPSCGCTAGSGPALVSTAGSTLLTPGDRCHTMNSAAGRSAGRPATSFSSAPMPPAEAPITTMSFVAMPRAMQASLPGMAPVACFATTNLVGGLFHQQDRALALLAGGDERRAGD